MPFSFTHPASYRDPSGFIYEEGGELYRQINQSYREHYEVLMKSGLYEDLVNKGWLISHEELRENRGIEGDCFRVIRPRRIFFVNYPYEWCFTQLRDAALLVLDMAKHAMGKGMILKDATPFNIMFEGSKPVFIDTLSFEVYEEQKPWKAYRQFCESFLAPLLLSSYKDPELIRLLRLYPSGIPLGMVAGLLPLRSRFLPLPGLHIHLQSRMSNRSDEGKREIRFSRGKLSRILTHLYEGIEKLKPAHKIRKWVNYYQEEVPVGYLQKKEKIVLEVLDRLKPGSILDLGCNTGYFSSLSGDRGISTVSLDSDQDSIDRFYNQLKKEETSKILPLCLDLTNPSPQIGWNNAERSSLLQRKKFDLVLVFALVHHLVLKEMVPFSLMAEFFQHLSQKYLLVEFVEPGDPKVIELIRQKEGVVKDYSKEAFLKALGKYFDLEKAYPIEGYPRELFLFQKMQRDS